MSSAAASTSAPPNHSPKRDRLCKRNEFVGALRPSVLPTVLFHSAAHSPPQRFAQPASTALSTSFLCVSASAGFTGTMVMLASLPMVQGCLPVLQLSASAAAFLSVSHIL